MTTATQNSGGAAVGCGATPRQHTSPPGRPRRELRFKSRRQAERNRKDGGTASAGEMQRLAGPRDRAGARAAAKSKQPAEIDEQQAKIQGLLVLLASFSWTEGLVEPCSPDLKCIDKCSNWNPQVLVSADLPLRTMVYEKSTYFI